MMTYDCKFNFYKSSKLTKNLKYTLIHSTFKAIHLFLEIVIILYGKYCLSFIREGDEVALPATTTISFKMAFHDSIFEERKILLTGSKVIRHCLKYILSQNYLQKQYNYKFHHHLNSTTSWDDVSIMHKWWNA